MKLYFLRHGKAMRRADWTEPDELRPLTDRGVAGLKREAVTLARLDLGLDLILTSPLVRARQTAEVVAEALRMKDRLVEAPALAPGFSVKKLPEVIARHPKADKIMLVGHEPDLSEAISRLTGGSLVVCRKGCLARVDVADSSLKGGRLVWLLQPEVLGL